MNRADITIIPRKRHDICPSDAFQTVDVKPPLRHWVQNADETENSGSSSTGEPVAGGTRGFEKLLEQSEGSFRRSVEELCLKCGMEFNDVFGDDFCNTVGSPFFTVVYREGTENPYDFAVRLYASLLAYATEINPAKVLRSVLESFIESENDNLMGKERFSNLASMIPKYVKVVVPLWALSQRTGFNLYVIGMELFQLLTPFETPRFDPLGVSCRFLEKIVDSERCCDKEKMELVRFILGALSHLIEQRNSAIRSLNIVSALTRKDYSSTSRYFGPFEAFCKKLNPYVLALKALSSNGTVEEISNFFSIIERKMRHISLGEEEFLVFASSLFEAVVKVGEDMADCLFRAGSLIEFSVIPSNESVLSVAGEDDRSFCEQFEDYERKSVDERFNFLTEIGVKNGEVPIYLYGAIARLLLDIGENEEMLLQMRISFPDFHILAFTEKGWLAKPVAYKLLYLHRIFAEGRRDFQRLVENHEEVLCCAEECKGDIRHMRTYIGKVYMNRLFEIPVLNVEQIMNLCPRAFKFSLQGANCPEIFNEKNEEYSDQGQSVSDYDGVIEILREYNFQVPGNDTTASLYAAIYEEDHEDSMSLMCGILASKYYINVRKYEQASELLTSVLLILRDLSYESEFMSFFLHLFRLWGELVYRDNAAEELINSHRFSFISELEANKNPQRRPKRFTSSNMTFLHHATRKGQGRKCTLACGSN
jgi:hypothetical protein